MRNYVIIPLIPAVFCLLSATSAFCWEESTAANVLVFADREISASYHLDDWTTAVDSDAGILSHQDWQAGSPPLLLSENQSAFTLKSGEVAVPNGINGASTPPAAGTPNVSMYVFDQALFANPTTKIPGLSASQPSGIYNSSLALDFTCHPFANAPAGDCFIEIFRDGHWFFPQQTTFTVYLAESADLQVRAQFIPASGADKTSFTRTYSYTITAADPTRDSDQDGFPDLWEAANNLNPLSAVSVDSDNDGVTDVDEILRGSLPGDATSLPLDSDHDGWSDRDELWRGTDPGDDTSVPVATRLYEVEVILSGTFSGGSAAWSSAPYLVQTIKGQTLFSGLAGKNGIYDAVRIPMGEESLIRAVNSETGDILSVARYLPMIPDPAATEMTATWTTAQEWQALYEQFLSNRLVVKKPDFAVDPTNYAQLALLARSLELTGRIAPES